MQAKEICRRVRELIAPEIVRQGVRLWDVTFEKEGGQYYLTVTIDQGERPADLNACEAVSRYLDPLLDGQEFDSLPSYTLCVSSAGLTRRLTRPEHFEACRGQKVCVRFYRAQDGAKELEGRLLGWQEDDTLAIETDGGTRLCPRAEVARVTLALDI